MIQHPSDETDQFDDSKETHHDSTRQSDVSVTLSLFDCQAVSFHKKLEGMRDDPKLIVATNINPKMVGGILLFYSV
ncbi:hypothetical protein Bca4012_039063 [Brassica carinata]